jgi:hypothetical protein
MATKNVAAKKAASKTAAKRPPMSIDAVKAARKVTRAVKNFVNGVPTETELKTVKALHDAGQHALKHSVAPDELVRLRQLSIHDMGMFTRRVGELILKTGETPLEFLVRTMRDATEDIDVRTRCAIAALPYVHQRLPALEHGAEPPEAETRKRGDQAMLESATEEELAVLERMARRMTERVIEGESTRS